MPRGNDPAPPRLALWVLGNLFDYRLNYDIEEDMREAFLALQQSRGAQSARRWYWRQTLKSFFRYHQFQLRGSFMMMKSAITTALRSMRRQRVYAAINIVGFATGLASCLLIGLFVANELSYDRHHAHADRIYRMGLEANVSGEEIHDARTPSPMAFTLLSECPEVEQVTRIFSPGPIHVQIDDRKTKEERFLYADSTVFQVFSIPLAVGDPRTALAQPSGLVITPETARRCFGDADPMGKRIQLGDGTHFLVTGITEPMTHNSHFQFDFLGAYASQARSRRPIWLASDAHTYVLLREGADIASLEQKLPDLERKYVGALIERAMGVTYDQFIASGSRFGFFAQRLLDIHLRSALSNELDTNGSVTAVLTLSAIALVILLIACINFVNLSTARSIQRANEVGVRKALGSHRGQLVRQFLTESVVQCVLAFVIALGLMAAARPYFQSMMQNPMSLGVLDPWLVVPVLLLTVLLVGLAAGIYPALVMASYQPMAVLRGKIHAGIKGRRFRAALVIFQLTASVGLLISAMVIQDQMRYMRNKPLGFNPQQVLVLQNLQPLGSGRLALKQALLQSSNVESVTYSVGLPFLSLAATIFQKAGQGDSHNYTLVSLGVDSDFMKTYGIQLLQGRTVEGSRVTDSSAVLISETGARLLGLEEPVGQHLIRAGDLGETLEIVGVVRDFHLTTFRDQLYPMVMMITPLEAAQYLSVRIRPERVEETLRHITEVWNQYVPGQAIDYLFLDDQFEDNYKADLQMQKLIGAFTGLALLVACLGLFGLASLTTKMRTKEVGIRKTLGASIPRIVSILTKEIITWVAIANLLAWPLAWWAMGRWLQGFAYRTSLSLWTFLLAGFMALAVALITVGQLTYKAATRRPVETLRYE